MDSAREDLKVKSAQSLIFNKATRRSRSAARRLHLSRSCLTELPWDLFPQRATLSCREAGRPPRVGLSLQLDLVRIRRRRACARGADETCIRRAGECLDLSFELKSLKSFSSLQPSGRPSTAWQLRSLSVPSSQLKV